jgi:4-amino-4-deoxy-L-arabinose transferase-like glycosyltransferase
MCKLSTYQKSLWMIALVAFIVRVGVRCYLGADDFWLNGYTFLFTLAKNIAAGYGIAVGYGLPTCFRVPLYPAFLAAVTFGHKVFLPIVIAQALIGAGTVWCTAMITREMFGKAAAIIAATLTAIYPYYVIHDTALQETSLYTFLTAASVLLLLRTRRSGSKVTAAGAGLALGAAVLTRANLAPFALIAPLWLALAGGVPAAPWPRRFYLAVLCASAGALIISPWLIRSYRITGSATLTTQSGYFLWIGNNPYTFGRYPEESIDNTQADAFAGLSAQDRKELEAHGRNEAAVDQWYGQKGLEYIRAYPWQTVNNGFRKILTAFSWWPSPSRGFWPSLVHALSYGPVLILGLWGMWASRMNWRKHSIVYLQFVAFAAVTATFFGHTGYRAYLDVYLIVFAAGSLAVLLSKHHVAPSRFIPKSKATCAMPAIKRLSLFQLRRTAQLSK